MIKKASRGESLLRMFLKRVFPLHRHFYNVRNLGIINPATNQELEIDIYIPLLKVGFEFNGMQHHTNSEQKKRDTIKKKICKEKGITLITIWTNTLQKENLFEYLSTNYPHLPFKKPSSTFLKDFNIEAVKYVNNISKMNKQIKGSKSFIKFK